MAAGLVETLSGPGPFAVFAPTNAAFAKLPAGAVETLLKPAYKGKLVEVLTYHVVPGRLSTKDLMDAAKSNGGKAEFKTVEGEELRDGDGPGQQGQYVQDHHPERFPVKQRHPRGQHRAAAGRSLAPGRALAPGRGPT